MTGPQLPEHVLIIESKAGCCVSRFIQDKWDIVACPRRLNRLRLTYFLLALFLAFLFFLLGLPLESCQKWWATAIVPFYTVVVIFCCLSSSPCLAWIWRLCVHEVLQAPQGLPFPHHWRHEVFDTAGGRERAGRRWRGVAVSAGLAQRCLLLLRPKMSSLDSLCYNIRYKQSHITHVETLAGNQTHTHSSCSLQAITWS